MSDSFFLGNAGYSNPEYFDTPIYQEPIRSAPPQPRPQPPQRETAPQAPTPPKDHKNKVYVCGFPRNFPIQAFLDWLKHSLKIEVCGATNGSMSAGRNDKLKIWYGNHNELRWGVIQCLSLCNQHDAQYLINVKELKFDEKSGSGIPGFKAFYLQFRKYQRKRKNRKRNTNNKKPRGGKQGRKQAPKKKASTPRGERPQRSQRMQRMQPQYPQMSAPMTPHFSPITPLAPNPYSMPMPPMPPMQYMPPMPPMTMTPPVAPQRVFSRPPIVPVAHSQRLSIVHPSSISQPEHTPEKVDAPITEFAPAPGSFNGLPAAAPYVPTPTPMNPHVAAFTPSMRVPAQDAAGKPVEYHIQVAPTPATDSSNMAGFRISKPRVHHHQPHPSLAPIKEEQFAA